MINHWSFILIISYFGYVASSLGFLLALLSLLVLLDFIYIFPFPINA